MTGTWATAYLAALADPADSLPFFPPSRAFSAQTVRQAVRLRRGGSAVRLALSNEFGHAPLIIDEVTVSGGHAVQPALLDGQPRWEIPAGGTAVSDPVTLTTTAGGELTVSCFASRRTEPATYLHSAQRSGEVAPGNQASQPRLTRAQPLPSLYWITQVLTDTPAQPPVIVALGDSVTRGDGTTVDRDQRYPDHLQRRLLAAGADDAAVLNAGIGGNRVLRSQVGPSMVERFSRDVLGVAGATHVVIMGGLNDLGLPSQLGQPHPTAGDIAGGLLSLAHRARQHGIQPVLGTITPFGGTPYEAMRADGNPGIWQAVNDAIRSQRDWPVADFAAALADPDDPARLAPAFDSGDGMHPGDAGARALADTIDLALFR
jgi:lysophospholipase L1-like esterase